MDKNAGVCVACGSVMPKPCPKCETLIEKDSTKFCPECGESLVRSCGGCGAQIEGNPNFCPECGQRL